MSDVNRHKVRITKGEHKGREAIVVGYDPKWVRVRLLGGSWPFPVEAWVHRSEYERVDALEGMAAAPY